MAIESTPAPAREGTAFEFPVPVFCPQCRDPGLERDSEATHLWCSKCSAEFGYTEGFPDLIVGARFDDESDDDCQCYEDASNQFTTENFWIPLFQRIFAGSDRRPRILAVGCGTGAEVDLLHAAGFDAVGIEIGNRTRRWPQRTARSWLMLANGMHLPFPDGSFDGAFCGCVFPHVGVVGDSNVVSEHCCRDRLALAREMSRVVRVGGHVLASSPNRWFPLDIFHGRAPGSFKPRLNWPGSRFLLSVSDYREMWRAAGCEEVEAEPVTDYWGFLRSRNSLKGRVLGTIVKFLFWFTSTCTAMNLRGSMLAPWIVVRAIRTADQSPAD